MESQTNAAALYLSSDMDVVFCPDLLFFDSTKPAGTRSQLLMLSVMSEFYGYGS